LGGPQGLLNAFGCFLFRNWNEDAVIIHIYFFIFDSLSRVIVILFFLTVSSPLFSPAVTGNDAISHQAPVYFGPMMLMVLGVLRIRDVLEWILVVIIIMLIMLLRMVTVVVTVLHIVLISRYLQLITTALLFSK
jgi:hypothetical protein